MDNTRLRQLTAEADTRNSARTKSLLTFEAVHKVMVLFDDADYEGIVPFLSQLESSGRKVRAWSFSPDYDPAVDARFDRSYRMFVMSKRHFDSKGLPLQWVERDFRSWDAELLIDLSRRENPVTEYFAATSSASFKIGLKTSVPSRYELVFDVSHSQGDISQHVSRLMVYYRSLKPAE